jgi:alkylation response protein AidB-like acyl-CoA dehydrogenase
MPLTSVRGLYETSDGFHRDWWSQAAELGWTSLFVPEGDGGGNLSGCSTIDAAIVAEEMGRLVSPGPFRAVSVFAAGVAAGGPAALRAEVLPSLVAGDTIGTWAATERGSSSDPSIVTTVLAAAGDELVLDGEKVHVEAAGVATHALVVARYEGGLTQVVVPLDAPGVRVVRGRSVDMTRRFGTVHFAGVRVPRSSVVGELGGAEQDVRHLADVSLALQCAELVGVADRTLEFTLEYGKERYAFGRPIVSFQALKHRIADMVQWLESCKAVADRLAEKVDAGDPDAHHLASVAKAYVGDRAPRIVDDCVQITGGIGVTWEHDIHLYNRRAALERALLGSPEEHKERVFAHLAEIHGGTAE